MGHKEFRVLKESRVHKEYKVLKEFKVLKDKKETLVVLHLTTHLIHQQLLVILE